ncbi:DTW domain-containing protein [Myxococcota bacterium]|nr:DTW domain-containing protein [Myxococcota bacterium]
MPDPAPPGRCPACLLPAAACLCAWVPRVETATRFEVIRHVREAGKASNSARVARLAMPALRLHDYGAPGPRFDPTPLLGPGTALLFPPEDDGSSLRADPAAVRRVLVLDGSWSQARRMAHRIPGLFHLPRLVLPPPDADRARLRRPPTAQGMATLEAVAAAVALLEGPQVAAPLVALFDLLVARGLALRGRPLPSP